MKVGRQKQTLSQTHPIPGQELRQPPIQALTLLFAALNLVMSWYSSCYTIIHESDQKKTRPKEVLVY